MLHAFQKKSKKGHDAKAEIDLLKARLKRAGDIHAEWLEARKEKAAVTEKIEFEVGSGNVFADLGLPNPEERLAKAELASRIGEAVRQRRLTQAATAELLGIDQPKVSRLMRGYLTNFSTDRLMHFLTLL